MKRALPSFQEKKGSMAPCLACGLHKITVAENHSCCWFFTRVLVSQNTSRVSRVLRGLLISTVSKRCCFHLCLDAHSQLSFLGIMCPFLYVSALGSIPA